MKYISRGVSSRFKKNILTISLILTILSHQNYMHMRQYFTLVILNFYIRNCLKLGSINNFYFFTYFKITYTSTSYLFSHLFISFYAITTRTKNINFLIFRISKLWILIPDKISIFLWLFLDICSTLDCYLYFKIYHIHT